MCQKKFEELELRDDFIFGKVMRNKALCKKTLEILLGIQIEDIDYPETQKAINITYQGKSVRLDVYVEDDKRSIYNAEMQQKSDEENIRQLPKRSRYYQGIRAKRNEKWRREYMKELLHDFDMKEEGRREGKEEGRQKGREEGREEGRQKVNLLNRLLAGQNRTEDIIRSVQDADYQKKLFEEFQI